MDAKTTRINLLQHLRSRKKEYLVNFLLFVGGVVCLSQGVNEHTKALAYFSSFFFYLLVKRLNLRQNLVVGFLTGALHGYAFLGYLYFFKYTVVLIAVGLHGLLFSTTFTLASILFKKFPKSAFVHIFSFGFILFLIRLLFYYSHYVAYVDSFLTVVNTSSVFDYLMPYLGTSITDILVLSTGSLIAHVFLQIKAGKVSKYLYLYLFLFVALFIPNFYKLPFPSASQQANSVVKIALIQPNIDWPWEERLAYSDDVIKYFILETETAVKKGAKIVVWPEHAILTDIFHKRPEMARRLMALSHKNNVVIVAGALEFLGDEPNPKGKWIGYDTSVVFDPESQNMETYRAIHPVSGNVKVGNRPVIFGTKYGSFPVISCFEVAYHKFVADYSNQGKPVDFFIGIANIQVFLGTNGGTSIQDHIRRIALENGKYFIYVSNTGPSLILHPNGNIIRRIPEGERKTLIIDIPQIREQTFYSKYQLLPTLLLFILCYSVAYIQAKQKKNN